MIGHAPIYHAAMVPLIQFIAGIVVYGLSGGLATLIHEDEPQA